MTRRPPLFVNRDFWLLWSAYVISTFGDHVAQMSMLGALGFDARTDPTQKLHLNCWLQLVFFLPYAVLGPINGWLADRLPRRIIMISADLARSAILIAIPLVWFGMLLTVSSASTNTSLWGVVSDPNRPFWHGVVPYLLIGVFAALFSPARAAVVPTLVRESDLVRANSLLSGGGVVFSGIGFLVGGELASSFLGPSFFVTAFTFFTSACFVFLIRTHQRPGESHALASIDTPSLPKRPKPTLWDGLRYVASHRAILKTILISGLFWGLVAVVTNGVAVAATRVNTLGQILIIFTLGMFVGAVIFNFLSKNLREPRLITVCLLAVGLWLILYSSVAFAPPAMGLQVWYRHGLAFLIGLFAVGIRIGVETLLQRLSPDRLRGRIFGICDVVSMVFFLLFTVGLMIPPQMGEHLPTIFAGCGLLALGTGLLEIIRLLRKQAGRPT